MEQHPETSPGGTTTVGDRGLREGQGYGRKQGQARLPRGRCTPPRPRRPRADPAQPGWQSSGRGARVPAASPAGELEGEEQGAAESHGSAQQLRPLARHKRGAAQPAADPALRGRRRPGRAEGAGALGAATLVLGVLAVVPAAAAAASAFRHYMLPWPALYRRYRHPGPGDPAPHVAPGPHSQRRPLTRTLHVSHTSETHRPPTRSLRECGLPAKPRPLGGPRPRAYGVCAGARSTCGRVILSLVPPRLYRLCAGLQSLALDPALQSGLRSPYIRKLVGDVS